MRRGWGERHPLRWSATAAAGNRPLAEALVGMGGLSRLYGAHQAIRTCLDVSLVNRGKQVTLSVGAQPPRPTSGHWRKRSSEWVAFPSATGPAKPSGSFGWSISINSFFVDSWGLPDAFSGLSEGQILTKLTL